MKKWNWRSYIAGMATVALLAGVIVPAAASSVGQILRNQVNVVADGMTISGVGQNYMLSSGTQVPGSLTYIDENGGGTVYLPVRRVSEILNEEIGWDGARNAVVIGEQQVSAPQYTSSIYYEAYPDVLSIQNVTSEITYYNDFELNDPEFDIFCHIYSYQAKTFDDAKRYCKEYADYLMQNGYILVYDGIYKTIPEMLGEPSHQYQLLTPDRETLVSIRYDYTAYTGQNLFYIDVDLEPSDPNSSQQTTGSGVVYYSRYPGVPDFGAFAGIEETSLADLIGSPGYYYDVIDVDDALNRNEDLLIEYDQLLYACGFSYIGDFDGDTGPVQCYSNGVYSIAVGLTNSRFFAVLILEQ